MKKINRSFRRRIVTLLFLAIAVPASAQTPSRVVAIGDVHGAYAEFVSILQRTGQVDTSVHSTGDGGTVAQLGVTLALPAASRAAPDLVMRLEAPAAEAAWTVIR